MVKFSYQFEGVVYDYKLPTAYNEITISQYVKSMSAIENKSDPLEVINILTLIPMEHLESMPEYWINEIDNYVSLIWNSLLKSDGKIEIDKIVYTHYSDYGLMIIGQWEDFKKYTKGKNQFETIPFIMAFLSDGPEYNYKERLNLIERINNLPATLGIFHQNLFLLNCEKLEKRFVYLFQKEDIEDALIQAGYNTLNDFGFYSNLESMGGGDLFKMKEVMTTLSVNEVYYHLTYLKTKNAIEKNYRKIKENELRSSP